MWLTAILSPECLVAQKARRAKLYGGLGERKRDPLKTSKASAERLPIGDIAASFFHALLGGAVTHQADQRAAEIEPLHHLHETCAFGSDSRFDRYAHRI